jgi:deoxycytidylate deaminase
MLFFEKAALIAANSPVKNHRHGCVLVKDGEIISDGFNTYVDHMAHKFTIHAEVAAIGRLRKKITQGCELYIVRIGKESMGTPLKYSKPCIDCSKAINKAGIKKVFYSIDPEGMHNNYTKNRKYYSLYDDSSSSYSSSSSSSSSSCISSIS